jgi:hypothetical protein
MGWSLSTHLQSEESELIDAVLLSAGKALHIANEFERKCACVLDIARLVGHLQEHQGETLMDAVDALTAVSKRKMLGGLLSELQQFPPLMNPDEVAVLNDARNGRNFIAHEGAAVGRLWNVKAARLIEHLSKLRQAVNSLAEGDNLVSRWVYEIEEKELAPWGISKVYPQLVHDWVFGHVPFESLDAQSSP